MKFFNFLIKCKQIRVFLRICFHLLMKSLMENFNFYKVVLAATECVIENMFLNKFFFVCFMLIELSKIWYFY